MDERTHFISLNHDYPDVFRSIFGPERESEGGLASFSKNVFTCHVKTSGASSCGICPQSLTSTSVAPGMLAFTAAPSCSGVNVSFTPHNINVGTSGVCVLGIPLLTSICIIAANAGAAN